MVNDNPEEVKPLELRIAWNKNQIRVDGCVKNEVASLFMLEKAKDIVKHINRPQIIKPKLRV